MRIFGNRMLSGKLYLAFVILISMYGCDEKKPIPADISVLPWDSIEARAAGQTVNMMMWMGDPLINDYMNNYTIPAMKERFDIDLQISSGQGSQIVNHLLTEKEAGRSSSALDMVWINGETFYQLRQINALEGPFVDQLPNSRASSLASFLSNFLTFFRLLSGIYR